jgi:isoleucyl-tRNA synthetase
LKVLQSLKTKEREGLTPIALRKKAASFATETMAAQRESFKRYGVWGDWEKPYMTLQPEYEAAQIRVFGDMVTRGHIYRGKKPVHWSPSSRTALAEAELEYPENHISRSIYVGFKVTSASEKLASLAGTGSSSPPSSSDIRLAIWTTTPWTIPANLAVAVNADLDYAVVTHPNVMGGAKFVVAKGLIGSLTSKVGLDAANGEGFKLLGELKGSDLVGTSYQHPLYDRVSQVVIGGDYITTESGTGLVHTAPGHGQEDYQTGLKYGLPLLSPVNDMGCFTEEAGERFQGLDVLGDGNTAVITALNEVGALIKEEAYNHKYPYDWRTKKPTIFRATEQWFASVSTFRQDALDAIDSVQWIPAIGRNRIASMTESRGDWCISRQRSWGVPIPVFYKKSNNEPLMTPETLKHIENIFREKGSDAWWEMSIADLMPAGPLRDSADDYTKGECTSLFILRSYQRLSDSFLV